MTDITERAARARQITEDDLFIEAWQGIERGAIERLAMCDATDTTRLQTLTLALQSIRAVRNVFEAWVFQGKEAADREYRKSLGEQTWKERLDRFRSKA